MKVSVSPEARKAFEPMIPDLLAYFKNGGKKVADKDIALEVERHFGERILHEVCIPLGLDMGACLVVAIALMKEAFNGGN